MIIWPSWTSCSPTAARLTQLIEAGEVQAIAVWRVFHTTYSGRLLRLMTW
jgi:hypothetical protein